MNTIDCIREFQRKYAGTYFFFKKHCESHETLIYCESVESQMDAEGRHVRGGVMRVNSLECGRLLFNIPSEHTFVFKMPPVGVFQYGKVAVHVTRLPRRQWRRGLCSDNTSITPTISGIIACELSWSLDLIDELYRRKTFDSRDALSLLKDKGYLSVALRDQYSVAKGLQDKTFFILHQTVPVALYDTSKDEAVLYQAAYEQEVMKLIKEL